MHASRLGQRDLACKSNFTTTRVSMHLPARGDGSHLQTPAQTKHWNAASKQFAHYVDLTKRFRFTFINVQRRAGDGQAVVGVEITRRSGGRVCRSKQVYLGVGRKEAQDPRIALCV